MFKSYFFQKRLIKGCCKKILSQITLFSSLTVVIQHEIDHIWIWWEFLWENVKMLLLSWLLKLTLKYNVLSEDWKAKVYILQFFWSVYKGKMTATAVYGRAESRNLWRNMSSTVCALYCHLCIKMLSFLFVRVLTMPRILNLSCGIPFPV